MDESTGEGTGEGGDRRRAKGTMKVRDKAGKGWTGEGAVGGVGAKGDWWSGR